jgi:hypothetical protein
VHEDVQAGAGFPEAERGLRVVGGEYDLTEAINGEVGHSEVTNAACPAVLRVLVAVARDPAPGAGLADEHA